MVIMAVLLLVPMAPHAVPCSGAHRVQWIRICRARLVLLLIVADAVDLTTVGGRDRGIAACARGTPRTVVAAQDAGAIRCCGYSMLPLHVS